KINPYNIETPDPVWQEISSCLEAENPLLSQKVLQNLLMKQDKDMGTNIFHHIVNKKWCIMLLFIHCFDGYDAVNACFNVNILSSIYSLENNDGQTIIHTAARKNNINTLKSLLRHLEDEKKKNEDEDLLFSKVLGTKDKNGNTAFHLAFKHRNHSLARLIALYMPLNLKTDILLQYCSNDNISELERIQIHSILYENTAGCDLYLMSELPEFSAQYKNSYLFIKKHDTQELYYIKYDGGCEKVNIVDFNLFEVEIKAINYKDKIKLHLNNEQIKEIITSNGGPTPKAFAKEIVFPSGTLSYLEQSYWDLIHNKSNLNFNDIAQKIDIQQIFSKDKPDEIQEKIFHLFVHLFWDPKPSGKSFWVAPWKAKDIQFYFTDDNHSACYAPYKYTVIVPKLSNKSAEQTHTYHLSQMPKQYQGKIKSYEEAIEVYYTGPNGEQIDYKQHREAFVSLYVIGANFTFERGMTDGYHPLELGGWRHRIEYGTLYTLPFEYIKKNHFLTRCVEYVVKNKVDFLVDYIKKNDIDIYSQLRKLAGLAGGEREDDYKKIKKITDTCLNKYYVEPSKLNPILHKAVQKGNGDLMKDLIKKGACLFSLNKYKKTAIEEYLHSMYEVSHENEELHYLEKNENGRVFFERKQLNQFLSIWNDLRIGINLSGAPTKVNTLRMDKNKIINTQWMNRIIKDFMSSIKFEVNSQKTIFYYNLMVLSLLNRTFEQDKYPKKDMRIETEELHIKRIKAWERSFEKELKHPVFLDKQFNFFKTERLKESMQCEDLTFRRCAME
ncbi:MAG: ankyrin repeat domain-containing protein, partial [Silvanigrellaceae bacterium]|nr:ankyrin repeat domain-containing protein [Silvanigrellaceae bacterium]